MQALGKLVTIERRIEQVIRAVQSEAGALAQEFQQAATVSQASMPQIEREDRVQARVAEFYRLMAEWTALRGMAGDLRRDFRLPPT